MELANAAEPREVTVLRLLSPHPNVVSLLHYEVGPVNIHSIVMEACTGGEVFTEVRGGGQSLTQTQPRLPEQRVRTLFPSPPRDLYSPS